MNGCTVNGTLDLRSLSVGNQLALRDTIIRPDGRVLRRT